MVKGYFKNPVFISVIVLCIIFYSGVFNISDKYSIQSLIPENKISYVYGSLISSPVKSLNGKNYSVNMKLFKAGNIECRSGASGIIKILIPSELVEVHFPGKLYTKAGNDSGYNYEAGGCYYFEGKFSKNYFTVKNCYGCEYSKGLFGKIDEIRALGRLQFKRLMFSWKEAGGLLLALLCGAREYTEQNVSEAFRKAGLSHILALSGMHLSMFSAIAIFIGNRIKRKKITFIIRVVVLIVFLWFAGVSPSLTRAFICSMLLILASIASVEEPDMILILCFSFLLQSIMYPRDIYNYGFMLSYGALSGILLTSKYLARFYDRILPKSIAQSFAASTGAQIFTMPLSLRLFGSFSPAGIIATTIVSPLISIFIYSGLILIIVCLIFPVAADYSGILLNFEYTIIKYIVSFFSWAPRITI